MRRLLVGLAALSGILLGCGSENSATEDGPDTFAPEDTVALPTDPLLTELSEDDLATLCEQSAQAAAATTPPPEICVLEGFQAALGDDLGATRTAAQRVARCEEVAGSCQEARSNARGNDTGPCVLLQEGALDNCTSTGVEYTACTSAGIDATATAMEGLAGIACSNLSDATFANSHVTAYSDLMATAAQEQSAACSPLNQQCPNLFKIAPPPEKSPGQIVLSSNGVPINTTNPEPIRFLTSDVPIGQSITKTLTIRNVSPDTILDLTVQFIYSDPGPDGAGNTPALLMSDVSQGESSLPLTVDGVSTSLAGGPDNPNETLILTIQFTRYDDAVPRQGRLFITSNTALPDEQSVEIDVASATGAPVASIQPKLLDFGSVQAGQTPQQSIQVGNIGEDTLLVESVLFQGHPDYRLSYKGAVYEPGEEIVFEPSVAIAVGETETFIVDFAPLTEVPAEGKIRFFSNDPAAPAGILVELSANTSGPCIDINPAEVQFGGQLVGIKALVPVEIHSCGVAPLEVHGLSFSDTSSITFDLETTSLPGFEDNSLPTSEQPLTIAPGSHATFNVVYVPTIPNPIDANGAPLLDLASIAILSNAFDAELELPVSGLGVEKSCPTAIGLVQEGAEVIPQTNLHLYGDGSFSESAPIAAWQWSVKAPPGSESVFVPNSHFPNPTLEANVAGSYELELTVTDSEGVDSCVPWTTTVLVVPDETIHIEIVWSTPNASEPSGGPAMTGADLDLHFVHSELAADGPDVDLDGEPDGWFNQPFDCFWFNPNPNWGSLDGTQDDDPKLTRSDDNGAGPEILSMNLAEPIAYRVGVHVWNDHGLGASYVQLRVYINAALAYEDTNVKLEQHNLWDALSLHGTTGEISPVLTPEGERKITQDYQNPFFFIP